MRKIFLTLCMALTAVVAFAQDAIQVQTHKVVSLDEQFYVTFIIEGGKPSDFTWDAGEDFKLIWGPQQGRSSSVQIVNGKRTESSQTTFSYILKPLSTGKFTLQRASAKVNGKEIFSTAETIEVVNGTSSSGSSQQTSSSPSNSSGNRSSGYDVSGEDIFLRMSISRGNVVMGEPVIATLKLYQRVNIAGFENAKFPSFNGFWSQEIESPTNIEFSRESYGGQIYNSAVLRKYVLIPQKPGKLEIDPAELVCLVNVRTSSSGSSIFDGFFEDYATVRKKVVSSPVSINVSSLPSGAPASFYGGVGEFDVSVSVSKDTLKAHEAASLIFTVNGTGNVSLLETPKIIFPLDMEEYDPKVKNNLSGTVTSGSKVYEYPFIPRSYGDFVIEPIKYSYYDIRSRKYVTLQTEPINLTVLPSQEITSSASTALPGVSPKDVRNIDSDIRYINVKDMSLDEKGGFFVGSSTFWALVALIIVIFLVCWMTFRTLSARRADVTGSKVRKATQMAMRRLSRAKSMMKKGESSAFYEELHKALLGYVSDKLNVPVTEMNRDRITETLTERNVPVEDVNAFIGILDDCEFARYAPQAVSDAVASHYEAAVEVISSMDSKIKTRKMGKNYGMVLLLMLLPVAAGAKVSDSSADSLWNAGAQAYSAGLWMDAAESYEQISEMGLESAALYCNIGNAYYKDGNIPMAILNYERSLRLDPSYSDARYNLDLMNDQIQDRIEPVPEFFLKSWLRDICYRLSSDAWAVVFIVLLIITLSLVLLFILSPSVAGRRTGFFCGIATCVLMVAALSFSIWQKRDYYDENYAIVMRGVTSAKSSPSSENSTDLFVLHGGTKVEIIDQMGDWSNISLMDGRQGWIRTSDIERI